MIITDESGPREAPLLKRAIEEFSHGSTQMPMTETLLMAEPLLLLWVSNLELCLLLYLCVSAETEAMCLLVC